LTFKLVRARDQARLQCEFGAHLFNGSRDILYTNKQKTQSQSALKQNLTQFTACCKKLNLK